MEGEMLVPVENETPDPMLGIIMSCTYSGKCFTCDHEWKVDCRDNSPKMQCPECHSLNVDMRTTKILRIFLMP